MVVLCEHSGDIHHVCSTILEYLEILYLVRDQILQRDRALYYETLDAHKEKPMKFIRQWLNSYRDLLLHSLKEAKLKSLLHVRPISKCFNPA
jgi:hypothetical protein